MSDFSIVDDPATEKELDDQWRAYNDEPVDHRRISDDESVRRFGQTVQQRYEEIKSRYLRKDIPYPSLSEVDNAVTEEVEEENNFHLVSYPEENGEKARYWGIVNSRAIVYPTETEEDLDRLWDEFNSMIRKNQRESDWKSMELFGMNNQTHYEYLKSKFLEDDIDNELESLGDELDSSTIGEDEEELPSLFEAQIDKNPYIMDDSIEYFKDHISDLTSVPAEVLPYYDPEELEYLKPDERYRNDDDIEDADIFSRDFSIREWQRLYKEGSVYNTKAWEKEVYIISRKLEACRLAKRDTLVYENALLSLGWNPSIPFNEKTKMIGSIRYANKHPYELIDVTESYIEALEEAKKVNSALEPVYIILVQGKSVFSAAIKMMTKGPFSHAAISLDESLENLFSYNLDTGGLAPESVKRYGKDTFIGVYAVFVKPEDKKKIEKVIKDFAKNRDKTRYSIPNIITFVAGIPVERQYAKICSQFVDSVLKLADIDITKKPSSLVSPNDFMYKAMDNKKIYKLYEGLSGDFKEGELKYKVKKLRKSAQYIKEAKDLPVRFDDRGNLLIKNMKKLNFESEYAASHKLLLSYEKSRNYEGMKYELSKLWFLNQMIEKQLHDKNTSYSDKEDLNKARARILNDFYKYIDIVQKQDKEFNFNEYYNESPFSDATYKINPYTLKFTMKTMKDLIF